MCSCSSLLGFGCLLACLPCLLVCLFACIFKYVFVLRCQSTGLLVFLACLSNCLTCLLVCLFAYVVVCLASRTAVTMHKRSVSFFDRWRRRHHKGSNKKLCACRTKLLRTRAHSAGSHKPSCQDTQPLATTFWSRFWHVDRVLNDLAQRGTQLTRVIARWHWARLCHVGAPPLHQGMGHAGEHFAPLYDIVSFNACLGGNIIWPIRVWAREIPTEALERFLTTFLRCSGTGNMNVLPIHEHHPRSQAIIREANVTNMPIQREKAAFCTLAHRLVCA